MLRRRRAPTTQLARAGERTRLVVADEPIPELRFRAATLADSVEGTIEALMDSGRQTQPLGAENLLDARGLKELSVVPMHDTAITFLPPKRTAFQPATLLGAGMVLVAIVWTAWDLLFQG